MPSYLSTALGKESYQYNTVTFLAAALCVLGCVALARGLLSPLRKVPGPFFARFTNLWYLSQLVKGDFNLRNVKLHREKGKIVRLAPAYYSIDDPCAIKSIYGHGTAFVKSKWYDAWDFSSDPHATNLFSERDPKRHGAMRRKVASVYTMSSLVSYEPFVDNCVKQLYQRLKEFESSSTIIDLGYWLQCYSFDVIGEITIQFGKRFGFLDRGEDICHMMANLEASISVFSYLGLYSWFKSLFLFVSPLFGDLSTQYMQRFIDDRMTEAKSNKYQDEVALGTPVTMVRKLLNIQTSGAQDLNEGQVGLAAGANVAAGSDTTQIGLSSILFFLYTSPKCLRKLREELVWHEIRDRPSFRETQNLPYLQAVIKESMRLNPGVGLPLWREVPRGGLVVDGQFIPEKVNVGVNPWVAHRNSTIFGPDVDKFRPERWLEAGEDELKAMEHNFMPFGLGSRTCIGKNISILEINKLVPVIVKHFDFDLTPAIHGDVLNGLNRWFVKPKDFLVRVSSYSDLST